MRSFRATPAGTVNIDVSSSSQRIKLGTDDVGVRMKNNGSATVWFDFGDSTVTADVTKSQPLGSGDIEVQTARAPLGGDLYVAVIAAGSTGKVYFTPGQGI